MKYKLICSDLDDTLIDKCGKFGPTLKQAIEEYEGKGGRFRIVTGRMTAGVLPICGKLGLKGEVASYQGAIISDIETGEVLQSTTIPCDRAIEIGEFIEDNGYYYQTYYGDKFYTEKANEFTVLYGKLSCAEFVETEGKLSNFIREKVLNPPKILIMDDPPRIPGILKKLREKFGDEFLINTSKPFIIEIIPHGINKGLAVKFLAEKYGIKREEVICIGDSENDLKMLEYAGLSVCVESGTEIAKAHADVIAPSCDADAVAWVIRTFG